MQVALFMKVLKILNELDADLDDSFEGKLVFSVLSQKLFEIISQFFHYDVLKISAFEVPGQN